VNMLGIGLHSYGFMSGAFKVLMLFIGINLALIALGSLPFRFWKSFRNKVSPGDSTKSPKGKRTLAPA